MPMLAEVVDAVVGGDTHRDTHALELTAPSGATIATLMIGNDERGYAEAIAWVAEHAPGPRVVVGLEGTRSYGVGLARVLQTAGLTVVEIERPRRGERRRGKSDPIDAHLASLPTLRLYADRLPTPRAENSPQPRRERSIVLARAAHRQRRRPSAVPWRAGLRQASCNQPPRRSAPDPRNTPSGAPRPAASCSP